MQHLRPRTPFRLPQRAAVLAATVLLALASPVAGSAQTLLTESFSNVPDLSQRVYLSSSIAGTGLTVTNNVVQIITDATVPGHGNYLWMPLGWYQPVYNLTTNIGTAAFRASQTFDLLAGVHYTLSFDWSRQGFSAGNGPFPFSITAHLGSRSLQLDDNAGFFFGESWQTASLTFTPTTTEFGAIISFDGSGLAYAGAFFDNISMVGVQDSPPPPPPGPTVAPEPATIAMLVPGLLLVAATVRRKRRNG